YAIRPAPLKQVLLTMIFIGKPLENVSERHHAQTNNTEVGWCQYPDNRLTKEGARGRLSSAFDCHFNRPQNTFDIVGDVRVRKAQNLNAEPVEVPGSLMVIVDSGRREMRIAIDLDGQFRPWGVEVQDVGIDTILPAKLRSELLASEVLPEPLLCSTGPAPQR